MKVFLSWSGNRSKGIALALVEWLPMVSQKLVPFLSSRDLTKGGNWDVQLSDELKSTSFGIICLTQENKIKPWILFEAGALFKGSDKNRVCTLRIDLPSDEVEPPLSKFNNTDLQNKEDMRLLIRQLHAAAESTLPEKLLDINFDKYWPDLETQFQKTLEATKPAAPIAQRTAENKEREMLEILRNIEEHLTSIKMPVFQNPMAPPPSAITESMRRLLYAGAAVTGAGATGLVMPQDPALFDLTSLVHKPLVNTPVTKPNNPMIK